CLAGCVFTSKEDSIGSVFTSEDDLTEKTGTSYTIDELLEKSLSKNNSLDNLKDEDCTEEALYAYNKMIGYVENDLGLKYKIYDMYCSDISNSYEYVIKIVLEQDVEDFEAEEKIDVGDIRTQCLIYDKNGKIKSTVVAYIMGQKWREDVTAAMEKSFPQYHTNMCFVQLYNSDFHDITDNGYKDIYDYSYYYNLDEYNNADRVNYDNSVNVIAPVGTSEEDAEKIKEEVRTLLEQYCVTDICVMAPVDEETYDRLIAEEEYKNGYWFTSDMEWFHQFSIKRGLD
ncbi:MAG: hypothetical protein K2M82_04035, partial [Lachnospiraceae bacterium]|nr:hypothetical protein [Lachnospiraceae bacterium]